MATHRFPASCSISQEDGFVGFAALDAMQKSLDGNFVLIEPTVTYDEPNAHILIRCFMDVPAEVNDPNQFAMELLQDAVFKAMQAVDPEVEPFDGIWP